MKNALLIIDVQQGLFAPIPQPHNGEIVINNINTLIGKAKIKNIPIIFIQHEDKTELQYASDNWQLDSRLNSSSHDYFIRKTTPNSFNNTTLPLLLEELAIEQCIICGYASEYCIDTTIRQAASLGFHVILPQDAHTTRDKSHATASQIIEHHTRTLSSMTSFGVKIQAKLTTDIEFY